MSLKRKTRKEKIDCLEYRELKSNLLLVARGLPVPGGVPDFYRYAPVTPPGLCGVSKIRNKNSAVVVTQLRDS
jgi:hypothetical protein